MNCPSPSEDHALLAFRTILVATDRDTLAGALSSHYGARLTSVGHADSPFLAQACRAEVGGVHLHFCSYDTPVEIEFNDMAGIRQMFCLSSRARLSSAGRHVEIDADTTTIMPPGSSFLASYGVAYKQLVAQFDEGALRRKAEAIVGYPLPGPLILPTLEALPTASRIRSRETMRALARILVSGAPIDLPLIEMSQALSSAFLLENVSGFADRLAKQPKSASMAAVRVLEDYIQANWNRPLTVEEIAAACSVSVRSVFHRFKQHLGTAPLTYLRDLRLDHARQRLLSGDEDSVTTVAMACGFSSFGHFARRYRERFGELPSTTRSRR